MGDALAESYVLKRLALVERSCTDVNNAVGNRKVYDAGASLESALVDVEDTLTESYLTGCRNLNGLVNVVTVLVLLAGGLLDLNVCRSADSVTAVECVLANVLNASGNARLPVGATSLNLSM